MAKSRLWLGFWLGLGLFGCAARAPAPAPSSTARLPASRLGDALPRTSSVGYCLTRDGSPYGEERLTITSTGAVWRAEGLQRFVGAVGLEVRYSLELDLATADTRALSAEVSLEGERRTLDARVRGPWLEVRGGGVGGRYARDVAIAPGTRLLFPSPLFDALLIDLGGKEAKHASRVIRFGVPGLLHEVRRAATEPKGGDGRFAISPGEGLPPVAVWMGLDGLADRVRRFEAQGSPVEADRAGRGRCDLP